MSGPTNRRERGTALVTGAARRIGRAIALGLGRDGWRVAVHCRTADDASRQLAAGIEQAGGRAAVVVAELTDAGALARLIPTAVAALGPVTCLVNNASLFLDDSIATLDAELWDRHQAINLRAPILLAQAFAKHLPPDQRGNIVNIIDQRVWRPTPEFFSYAVSKAGLWTATRMLAQAFAPRIRVNGIGPGPVLKSIHQTDAAFAAEAGSTLLGHGTSPEEIAAAVRFVLDAPAMTGQMIALDGGQHLVWSPIEGGP